MQPQRGIVFCLLLAMMFVPALPAETPAAVIEGRVMLSGGVPVPDSKVRMDRIPSLSVVTDQDGRFRFENLPRGIYTVVTRPPGFRATSRTFSVSDEDTVFTEFIVIPFAGTGRHGTVKSSLEIIVIGGPEASPEENQPVTIEGPVKRTGVTDRVGRVTFTDLPPGSYKITATHMLYGTVCAEVKLPPGGVVLRRILRFFPR